jgi:hypothetical protein
MSKKPSPDLSRPKAPKRSSKILTKAPASEEEIASILSRLGLMGDQALAIVSVAYLDAALEQRLRLAFIPLHPEDDARIFDGAANGILGTTSSKIRVAYAMNLINFEAYHDLTIMNDIRNAFAHSLKSVSFKTKEIIDDCNKLTFIKSNEALGTILPRKRTSAKKIFCDTAFLLYCSIYAKSFLIKQQAS